MQNALRAFQARPLLVLRTMGPPVLPFIGCMAAARPQGKYVVLFFYPKDFTFVCPTEIIAFSGACRWRQFKPLTLSGA